MANASKKENATTVAEMAIIARDCTNDKKVIMVEELREETSSPTLQMM